MTNQPETAVTVDALARMLSAADVEINHGDYPTWDTLAESGQKQYRQAARYLLKRLHITAPAAVSAAVAPPTQTTAEAALAAVEAALCDTLLPDAREEALAGIAAVQAADRAAVLADFVRQLTDRLADCCTECDACAVIARDLADAELRRMADETATEQAQAHAPLTEWRVEILDGDEWMPASGLHRDRSQAAEQLRMASERRPLWNDGTPVRRRLVRETTTYTVEAETGPAVGARQDGAET